MENESITIDNLIGDLECLRAGVIYKIQGFAAVGSAAARELTNPEGLSQLTSGEKTRIDGLAELFFDISLSAKRVIDWVEHLPERLEEDRRGG